MPAATAPTCTLEPAPDGTVLRLAGAWVLAELSTVWPALRTLALPRALRVDGGGLTLLDSAGALALLEALAQAGTEVPDDGWQGFAPAHRRILDGVRRRAELGHPHEAHRHRALLARIGEHTVAMGVLLRGHLEFFGEALAALGEAVVHPRRLRLKEFAAQFEQICLNAIPVVALVSLLIGVTIAYLLGLQATKYGANIFVVDGVGIGMTREFAPLLVATIVAGRSGAAFTAQLGSMRLTEEIDAIRTLGLSPQQVLVVPRVLGLMLALPLLVFVGDVAGIAGAMLIADPMLGITPATFLDRLHEELAIRHFWIGLGKAPVFALAIAIIGCRMGMTVGRDTRAVGLATTSTVVQSIVAVILLDAAAAVILEALDL